MAEHPRSSIRTIGVALIALAAPALGGSGDLWNAGVVFILLGLLLVFAGPRSAPGRLFTAGSIGLALCAGAAFLPARWVGIPSWRRELVSEFGVPLPASITVHPWMTLEAMALLVAGIAWMWVVCREPWDRVERGLLARLVAAGVIVLAGTALLVQLNGWQVPMWTGARISPFPNRNHFSDLLATWAIVVAACGYEGLRARRATAAFWIAGLGLLFWALIANYSRAGIAIFFLGLGLWTALLCVRAQRRAGFGIAGAVLLIAGSLFLLFGADTLERFALAGGDASTTPGSDFRWPVFRDTLRMIGQSPVFGVGLGNFDTIFALFRDHSSGPVRVIHPESDFLLVLAQLGVGGFLCAAAVGGAVLARASVWRDPSPVRLAAFVGGVMFLLHGVVDISGHVPGSAFPALLLWGLALSADSGVVSRNTTRRSGTQDGVSALPHSEVPVSAPRSPTSSSSPPRKESSVVRRSIRERRTVRWTFILLGIGLIAVGAVWVRGWVTERPPRGSLEAEFLQIDAGWAYKERRFEDALALASGGLSWAPLDWKLRYYRGAALAYLGREVEAVPEFRLARRLEPNYPNLAYDEGRLWVYHGMSHVAEAWREVLRRDPARVKYWFGEMLRLAEGKPELRSILRDLAAGNTGLRLQWIGAAEGPEFEKCLEEWRVADPRLTNLQQAERDELLRNWQRIGDRAALRRAFEDEPAWKAQHWKVYSELVAGFGEYQTAVEIALRHIEPPKMPVVTPGDALQAGREFALRPGDMLAGYRLFSAQITAGQIEDALRTLERLEQAPQRPDYLLFLKAKTLAQSGQWEAAWQTLEVWQARAFSTT